MEKFKCQHAGMDCGPFTLVEIRGHLREGALGPMDKVFDPEKDRWVAVALFMHPDNNPAEATSVKPATEDQTNPSKPEPAETDQTTQFADSSNSHLGNEGGFATTSPAKPYTVTEKDIITPAPLPVLVSEDSTITPPETPKENPYNTPPAARHLYTEAPPVAVPLANSTPYTQAPSVAVPQASSPPHPQAPTVAVPQVAASQSKASTSVSSFKKKPPSKRPRASLTFGLVLMFAAIIQVVLLAVGQIPESTQSEIFIDLLCNLLLAILLLSGVPDSCGLGAWYASVSLLFLIVYGLLDYEAITINFRAFMPFMLFSILWFTMIISLGGKKIQQDYNNWALNS